MASLIGNLLEVLEEECALYEELVSLSMTKTPVIIKGDIARLQKITDEEQIMVGRMHQAEKKRLACMKEIAGVLNTDVETLKLLDLIRVLQKRPVEQQKLAGIHDRLKDVIYRMKRVNEQNQELIQSALEMNQFEISLLQAAKSAPETANYTRGAASSSSYIGVTQGRFDAKQ